MQPHVHGQGDPSHVFPALVSEEHRDMKENIVNSLENKITPAFLESVSAMLGENTDNVKLALSGIIPFLLNKVSGHLQYSETPSVFLKLLRELPELNTQNFTLSELLRISGPDSVIRNLLTQLMPDSPDSLQKTVINATKTTPESANALIALGSALLFKPMRDYLYGRTQQSLSLKSWLQKQTEGAINPIPAAFLAPAAVSDTVKPVSAAPAAPQPVVQKKSSKWPWLLLLLLIVLLLLFLLRGCGEKEAPVQAQQSSDSRSLWGDLGAFFSKALPDGKTLNIPQNGVENRLIAFIESNEPVSADRWFSFDRLLFKTNSAQLEPASQEQLKNIVEILRAYPKVKLKLGGYTDNTGTDEINMKLSQDRADAVRQALIELGADNTRIEAQGYGSAHPVAPNDTDENRAKNRRIDIMVTEK
ncbi:outer membrane protein OmpA-like peptidoglycan-associated protein [Enterobacillus tribolii]|uniref:Outer membrane protein OmpA-like peptidoglycan-associated protein n=2 Tax=Enterobacillus tribolii TaxID=1487935 RepID=A0A370QRM7_9GAMM|nr:outer membrane protein OmpA-like peptidoglycan-associated protein [Enterobacillus tribolii]